jgi:hypothetical protein
MPSDVLTTVSDITRLTPAQIRASSAEERNKLYGDVAKNPNFAKRFKEFNISSREQLASTVESSLKKGWFAEYVKGEKGLMSFGTLGKILSMKPVEGVVNAVTFNKLPILGKIARWSAVAAAAYFGGKWLIDILKDWNQGQAVLTHNFGRDVDLSGTNLTPTPQISVPGDVTTNPDTGIIGPPAPVAPYTPPQIPSQGGSSQLPM